MGRLSKDIYERSPVVEESRYSPNVIRERHESGFSVPQLLRFEQSPRKFSPEKSNKNEKLNVASLISYGNSETFEDKNLTRDKSISRNYSLQSPLSPVRIKPVMEGFK